MDRIPVQSSTLVSVGYDVSTSTLEIEFRNNSLFQYFGVPTEVYETLMASGSKGSYFHHNIKNAYPCSKIS